MAAFLLRSVVYYWLLLTWMNKVCQHSLAYEPNFQSCIECSALVASPSLYIKYAYADSVIQNSVGNTMYREENEVMSDG